MTGVRFQPMRPDKQCGMFPHNGRENEFRPKRCGLPGRAPTLASRSSGPRSTSFCKVKPTPAWLPAPAPPSLSPIISGKLGTIAPAPPSPRHLKSTEAHPQARIWTQTVVLETLHPSSLILPVEKLGPPLGTRNPGLPRSLPRVPPQGCAALTNFR